MRAIPSIPAVSAAAAAALDRELFSTGGFSVDQLMELAGLAVSQAIFQTYPPNPLSSSRKTRILVACGPGNNGGDGLVAARHLSHYGYFPTVYYPKRPKSDLFSRLVTQLCSLNVDVVGHDSQFRAELENTDVVVDAIFGFSFSGPVRQPFDDAISQIIAASKPTVSIDAPSGWHIDLGPDTSTSLSPDVLVSLTAPKPLVRHFTTGRHFLAGRFLPPAIAARYRLDGLPVYPNADQIVELPVPAHVVVAATDGLSL